MADRERHGRHASSKRQGCDLASSPEHHGPAGTGTDPRTLLLVLGGPPDPKGHLDCLSAVLRNGVLLFQQHPVKDEGWQREDVQSFYALMTRRITDADLSPSGVPDSCGVLPNKPLQLTGAAREGP